MFLEGKYLLWTWKCCSYCAWKKHGPISANNFSYEGVDLPPLLYYIMNWKSKFSLNSISNQVFMLHAMSVFGFWEVTVFTHLAWLPDNKNILVLYLICSYNQINSNILKKGNCLNFILLFCSSYDSCIRHVKTTVSTHTHS